jgi:hypothetical protein
MDKVEERIKKLEENQLKMAREFSKQGVAFFLTLAGMRIASLGEENYKAYEKYMRDNIDKANEQIGNAKDVDKVMALADKFTDDCIKYTESQFK